MPFVYNHFTLKSTRNVESTKCFNVQTPPKFAEKQFTTATATDFSSSPKSPKIGTFTGSTQAGFEGLERGMGGKKKSSGFGAGKEKSFLIIRSFKRVVIEAHSKRSRISAIHSLCTAKLRTLIRFISISRVGILYLGASQNFEWISS